MKIPFVFTFAGPLPRAIAHRLIDSIRKVMPESRIYQQTDMDTEGFEGCEVIRKERGDDFAEFFLRHLKELDLPRFIKIDYDCVIQKDVSRAFNDPGWHVGLTKRYDADPSLGPHLANSQPFNNGVIFSNGRHTFFDEVYACYMQISDRDGWMDAQEAVKTAERVTRAKIREFPCSLYNYTPSMPFEDLKDKYIIHYKGERKHWNLDTAAMLEAMNEGNRIGDMVRAWIKKRHK